MCVVCFDVLLLVACCYAFSWLLFVCLLFEFVALSYLCVALCFSCCSAVVACFPYYSRCLYVVMSGSVLLLLFFIVYAMFCVVCFVFLPYVC